MSRPLSNEDEKESNDTSNRFGDSFLNIEDDDFLRSQWRSSNRMSSSKNQHSRTGKTSIGSMDLLVLNTSGTVSLSQDNPNYYFDCNASQTPTKLSKLESKLSRHRLNDSIEYPADEVTVELSTTDDNIDGCPLSTSFNSNNNIAQNFEPCAIDERDEKKEPEKIGDCQLSNSIVCSVHEDSLENSHWSSELLQSNDAVAHTVNNSILNTSGISTILTEASLKPDTSTTVNSTIPNAKRYNHYDWSYSEEAARETSQSSDRGNNLKEGIDIKKSFDDASTLATVAASNTSIIATPDTSFESAQCSTDSKKGIDKIPPSPPRKSRTSASLRVPIEHDTLVVVEGTEETLEFRHSSLILQYASAELARYFIECIPEEDDNVLVERDDTIQFKLHVKVKDSNDWCILQPFLEPHAVQPAVVTQFNLPILLPWFKQLCLNVLLKECDKQLLDHVAPPPKMKHSKRKDDDVVAMLTNVLLLGRISVAAGLKETEKNAFSSLSKWMEHRPDVWLQHSDDNMVLLVAGLKLLAQCLLSNDDESSKDSPEVDASMESYEDLMDVWETMFEPIEAAYFFAAVLSYIPHDCVESQHLSHAYNVSQFLNNPLLPYFLREGILMEQKRRPAGSEVSEIQATSIAAQTTSDILQPSPYPDTRWSVSDSIASEQNVELALSTSPDDVPIARTTSVDSTNETSTHSSSPLLQVAEEWQAGWTSLWMKLSGTEPKIMPRSPIKESRCPHEVSNWLETVWKKLSDPPVFGAPLEVPQRKLPETDGNHRKPPEDTDRSLRKAPPVETDRNQRKPSENADRNPRKGPPLETDRSLHQALPLNALADRSPPSPMRTLLPPSSPERKVPPATPTLRRTFAC